MKPVGKREALLPFVGWGAGLAMIAGGLQQLGRVGFINPAELFGNALMGGLIGWGVWRWRNR